MYLSGYFGHYRRQKFSECQPPMRRIQLLTLIKPCQIASEVYFTVRELLLFAGGTRRRSGGEHVAFHFGREPGWLDMELKGRLFSSSIQFTST